MLSIIKIAKIEYKIWDFNLKFNYILLYFWVKSNNKKKNLEIRKEKKLKHLDLYY